MLKKDKDFEAEFEAQLARIEQQRARIDAAVERLLRSMAQAKYWAMGVILFGIVLVAVLARSASHTQQLADNPSAASQSSFRFPANSAR